MAKKASTIENRVYIFDTLAEALLEGNGAELLTSTREGDRARALRALADLAYVSCVVADTGNLDAEGVRQRLLADVEGPPNVPPVPSGKASRGKGKNKRKRRRDGGGESDAKS